MRRCGSSIGRALLDEPMRWVFALHSHYPLSAFPARKKRKGALAITWTLSSTQSGTGLQASTTYVGNRANVNLATTLTPVASGSGSTGSSGSSGPSGGTIALIAGGAVIVLGGAALAIVLVRRRHTTIAPETVAASEQD